MKLLLLGKDGQVGGALQETLPALGEVVALGHAEADFMHPASLGRIVEAQRPDVVVNAAAYTAVDPAENDRAAAWTINAEAVEAIGRAADKNGALFVHYSTDYVFDGMSATPYVETAATSPLNVYGASKLAGEVLLAQTGAAHAILRTSWVYAPRGRNFPLSILALARARHSLEVVADQIGAPTSAALIAEVTARIVPMLLADPGMGGLYHLAAAGETSWHGFAQALVEAARAAGAKLALAPDAIRPIPATQYPSRAPRPASSRLDTGKLRSSFGIELPPWQEGMRQLITLLGDGGRL